MFKYAVKDHYRELRDYALIGDCHGSALVSKAGAIDWCCLKRFDEDPTFFRLLDHEKGGFFEVKPNSEFTSQRSYLPRTNILKTSFEVGSSSMELTDFMPVARAAHATTYDYVDLSVPHWLIRRVKATRGEVKMKVAYKPSWDFGQKSFPLTRRAQFISSPHGPFLYSSCLDQFEVYENIAYAEMTLQEGEEAQFVLTCAPGLNVDVLKEIPTLQKATLAFWNEWSNFCRYVGPYKDQVLRSALVLKLLTYAPTGAIVAAPTTSLPETIGGGRNFDYRYSWIRDASFTLYALSSLGYSGEARRFAEYVQCCCQLTHPNLQVVYGIGGETDLIENELSHLEGYAKSAPVRTGNAAYEQGQLDIFGELQEGLDVFKSLGGKLGDGETMFIRELADAAVRDWKTKDHGIWEMRSEPLNHLYSKLMCWVAVDRASKIIDEKSEDYENTAREILESIQQDGINKDGSLRQAFENSEPDASLLRAALLGVPLHEEIFRATIERIEKDLGQGPFVYRYKGEDGFHGKEGAFLVCSFWLVSALLQIGEFERAKEKFERLLNIANDVGLYSEEIDVGSLELLGNFPQGLTHLALIECAVNMEIFENRGLKGLKGTFADRAQNYVGASVGVRGILAAYNKTGRIGRLFSSSHSKFPHDHNLN